MVHVAGNGEGQRKLLTFSNGALTGNASREDPEPNHNGHHPDSLLNSIIKTVFEQNPKETSFGDLLLPQQIQEAPESTVPLYSKNGLNLSCVIEEEPLLNTMTSTNILRGSGENIDQPPLNGNANLNLNVVSSTATATIHRTTSHALEDTHNSNTLNGNRNEVTTLNTNATTTTTAVTEEIVVKSNGNGNGHSKSASTTNKTSSEKKAANGHGKAAKEKVSQTKKKGARANESPENHGENADKVPLLASESSAGTNATKKSPSKKSSSSSPPRRTGESSSATATTTETPPQPTGATVAPALSVKTGKLSNGTKNPALKRVSFGNSKGTMVETLIYDNPVSEDQEISKTGSAAAASASTSNGGPASTSATNGGSGSGGAGPSGCVTPILKTTETNDSIDSTLSGGSTGGSRPPSRVRVTFFESEKPLAVSSPESDFDFDLSHNMTLPGSPITADGSHSYHRQTSGEIGWENPFRPDGDLSREADQIVELIKEGKPINEENLRSKSPAVLNSTSKFSFSKGGKGTNGTTNGLEVQRGVAAANQAGQVEHVNLKKQKKGCCVVQ